MAIAADDRPPAAALSTLGAGSVAVVDQRGRITPRGRPFSIDVWIGTGERWYFPSRESSVRQRRLDGLPIIETRLRIEGADVVATAWADEAGDGRGRVVVQLVTETSMPVVAGIVVRPFADTSIGNVSSLRVVDDLIVADGRPVVVLPRTPTDVVVGSSERGDIGRRLGDAVVRDSEVVAPDGSATLAAMFPLVPGTELAFQVVDGRRRASAPPAPLDRVVAGWRSHLTRAAELSLPGWPDQTDIVLPATLLGSLAGPLSTEASATMAVALGTANLPWASSELLDRVLGAVSEGQVVRSDWWIVGMAAARLSTFGIGREVVARHPDATRAVAGEVLAIGCPPAVADELATLMNIVAGERAAADVRASKPPGLPRDRIEGAALLGLSLTDALDAFDERSAGLRDSVLALRSSDPTHTSAAARAIVRAGGPTWTWASDGVSGGPLVAAWIQIARSALAANDTATGIEIAPGFGAAWLGRSVDVSRLPTRFGVLSYAIRWHGPRPALLWELADCPIDAPVVTAPNLDPEFASHGCSGEVLLAAPPGGSGG